MRITMAESGNLYFLSPTGDYDAQPGWKITVLLGSKSWETFVWPKCYILCLYAAWLRAPHLEISVAFFY